jgi:hypothetical protein
MAKKFANILGLSNVFGYNSETNTYLPYLLLDSVKNDINYNTICFVEADENDEGFNIKGYDIKAGDTFIITQKGVFGFFPKDGITPSEPENPGQVITSWRPVFINDENIAEIEIEYEDPESGDTTVKVIGNEYKLNLLNSDYLSISYTYDNENNIVGCKYELDINKLNNLYEFTEYISGNENVSIADVDNYEKAIIVNGYTWNPDNKSFSEGVDSVAKGYNSHAEGDNSKDGIAEENDSIIIYDFSESQLETIKNIIGTEVYYYTLSELQFTNIEIYPFSDAITSPVGRITFLKYYDGYQYADMPAGYCLNLEFYDGYTWDSFNYDENIGDNAKRFKYKYISGSYGDYSHTEGVNCVAYEIGSHASGCNTNSQGQYSHTEGKDTIASGNYSHSEGDYSISVGEGSHSEGNSTIASGDYSHAEGSKTTASGFNSHAEGEMTKTKGDSSHAEGVSSTSYGLGSHSEGNLTSAYGDYSHTEGLRCQAAGIAAHAEGGDTIANGDYSHAEGGGTSADGKGSHTEGYLTVAYGEDSHAEGSHTIASGDYSHTEGYFTETMNFAEHAEGMYNLSNHNDEGTPETKTLSSIGFGNDQERKNAFEVMQNCDVYINGIGNYNGTNAVYNENSPTSYTLQYVVNNLDDNLQNLTNTVSILDSKIDNEINDLNTNLSNRIDTIENSSTYTSGDNISIQDNKISALGYTYNPSYQQGTSNEYYDKLFCIKAKEKVETEEDIQFSNNDFTWEYITPTGDGGEEEIESTTLNYIESEYEDLTQIVHIGDTLTFDYYDEGAGEDISVPTTVIDVYPTSIVVEGNHYNINPSITWITIGAKYPKDANNIVVNDDGVYVKGLGDFNGVNLSDVKSLQTIILELQNTISNLNERITALESATASNE